MKFFAVILAVLIVLCGFMGSGFVDAGGVPSRPVAGQEYHDKVCKANQQRVVRPGKCTTVGGRKTCQPDIVECKTMKV